MLGLIIAIAFLALAAYAAYSAKTPTGWDLKKGLLAVIALVIAGLTWFMGLFQSAPSP
jgi:hypothetical protein